MIWSTLYFFSKPYFYLFYQHFTAPYCYSNLYSYLFLPEFPHRTIIPPCTAIRNKTTQLPYYRVSLMSHIFCTEFIHRTQQHLWHPVKFRYRMEPILPKSHELATQSTGPPRPVASGEKHTHSPPPPPPRPPTLFIQSLIQHASLLYSSFFSLII